MAVRLLCYGCPKRCPAIPLRLSSTNFLYDVRLWCDLGYTTWPIVLWPRYAVPGTDLGYGATRRHREMAWACVSEVCSIRYLSTGQRIAAYAISVPDSA
eukprot:3856996-Rhodomonas_salina.3